MLARQEKSIFVRPKYAGRRAVALLLVSLQVAYPALVAAQTVIIPDGRTQTTVVTAGAVSNVSTATILGANAFNSFQVFNVGAGSIANLHFPGSATNLINLVSGQQTSIHGILNAIKDGRIGGNVYFANPHGFVVGAGGVINVGSLSVSTPTQSFVDGFFLTPGNPSEAALAQLLSGTAPRSGTGLISVQGAINAIDGISLAAGTINVGGTIYSGARFIGNGPEFSDVVNANGLTSATNVVMREGRIAIVADGDVTVSGTIAAPGGAGVGGGAIDLRSGGNVVLENGASIAARGLGENSGGGTVNVWADHNAVARLGALVDASAGLSGDGGAIEFSAKRMVELAGGEFRAGAPGGRRGTVLIDPTAVTVSADFYAGGADHTIQADESITVNPGVTVSTRNVVGGAGADQNAANSAGDSGNLVLEAPSISMLSGSRLLAHADSGFVAGDITLSAVRAGGNLDVFSDTLTQIRLGSATIRGRNVTLEAVSSHASTLSPVVSKAVKAGIDIDSSVISASGNVVLRAISGTDASTPNVVPFGTVDVDAEASVNVRGGSQIVTSGTGNAQLSASTSVTARVLPGLPDFVDLPGDAGVAVAIVDSRAIVDVGGTSSMNIAGNLGLSAANNVEVGARADASASGSSAVGGTVAVAVVDTTTRASIGGGASVTQAGAVTVSAESENTVVASAKAAAGGAQQKGASQSKTEETLGDYQAEASTSDGGVTVAAAVAVSDLESTTQAYLASSAPVTSSGAVSVSSRATNQSEVTADGSSSEGGVGVGVGVALNLARLTNEAYVAQTVSASGLTVEALMAGAGGQNRFMTSSTSGAAASSVGVAGALAVNTVENRTRALVGGAGAVNAGGGNVRIEAANESESTAEAKPADGGTSGDSVGIGASVAINVATNEVRAAVEDGGQVNGAQDVTLAATGRHEMATAAEAGAAGGIGLTPVVAVSVADNTTTARLGSGGALVLSGNLLVGATHSGSTTTSAKADVAGEKAAIGAAVAVGVVSDVALATTDRAVSSSAGGIAFAAHADSSSSAVAKASAKGGKGDESGDTQDDGVDQEVGKQLASGKDRQASGSNNESQDPASAETAGDGGNSSKVSVAAAIAVNVASSKAEASVPDGRNMSAGGGELRLSASNNADASASADGSAVGDSSVGIGAGVAINVANSSNLASLGSGFHNAQGVTVEAMMTDTGDRTSSFGAEAKSGAGSGDVGVAGSLGLNIVDHGSIARINGGAIVNAGGGDVRIEAENRSDAVVKALPAEDATASGAKVGIGASVAVNIVANESRAELSGGATLNGADNLTVAATGEHAMATEAEAGSSGGISVTPVATISVSDNQTVARLGAGNALDLAGGASVSADHASTIVTSAKGSSQGEKASVGIAVAVTVASDSALATTDRDIHSAGGNITFLASSAQSTDTSATASAKGGKQEDENTQEDGVDKEVDKQASFGKDKQKAGSNNQSQQQGSAQSSEGKVSVAAAVAVNVADSSARAYVPDGRVVNSSGALTVQASNNTDARAAADGSAAGSTATVGIGAAVAVNKATARSEAYIGDADISTNGVAVRSLMTNVGGDATNTFAAEAKAGAGGGKVGIAGALALNLIDVSGTAGIHSGAAVNAGGGNVEVTAQSNSSTTASALPEGPASGGQVGVGASVALNLFSQDLTLAEIGDNANVSNAGSVSVSAVSDSDTAAEAEAGAAGSIAVDAVVALTEAKQTTQAIIGAGSVMNASGSVSVTAVASGDHTATATGDVKSNKAGVGASAAIIISNTTTEARLARSVTTAGDLTLAASGRRSYEAVAKASAGGGKDSDSTTQAEKDKAKSTSTLKDNESAQQGTEKTGSGSKVNVAAAAGVLVLDDDVTAAVTGGLTLDAGGNIGVSAANSSDFSARGLGDAIDITKLTSGASVGIGVGVGMAIVRNDTAASIGNLTHITNAGDISVTAESKQNASAGFANKLAAEGVAGAGSEKVSVAGALAVANSNATTHASIGDGVVIDQADAVSIEADNTSKLSAKAWSAATSGKVGIGASVAIIVSDNEYQAWLGQNADVTAASLAVAARNHKLTGPASFDWSLDGLQDRFTDANLQILLGQNNYYTETIAGAGSNQVAVAGAFSVNVFDDTTEAWIGQGAQVTATGAVDVTAANDTTAKAFAGGVAGAGKVGVGLASADVANKGATRAYLADSARIRQAGSVALNASADLDLATISASAAGASTAGVGGVLSLILSENTVEAYAGDGSRIDSDGAVGISAGNDFTALTVAGVAGVGGTAGVGVSAGVNVVDNRTRAWIGSNATVDAAGLTSVDAASSQDVVSVVVGGSGGGTAGVAASAATNVFNPLTRAWIGAGTRLNAVDPLTSQSVRVSADSSTDLLSIVGTVGIGGTAGVGGAADVVVIDKDTRAWIEGAGSDVRAGNNIQVLAGSEEKIRSIGAGFSAGGTAGVQGAASVVVLTTDTQAYLAGGASAHSEGNAVVAASGDSEIDMLAGAGAIGGTAGVGAAAAVAVVDKTTHAWIGDNAEVTALGLKAGVQVASGSFGISYATQAAGEGEVAAPGITPSNGENEVTGGSQALTKARLASGDTRTLQGLAVTAVNQDDVASYAVTGAASGTASVTLSGDVSVFNTDTQAWIGSGSKINESNGTAGANQSVLVAAGNDFFRLGIAGALAASGTAGVGVGADVAVMSHQTKAGIGNGALINARRDVDVAARSSQEVLSISASLGASGTVGVSGSVSVLSFDNETWAQVGDGAGVDAGGNVAVLAQDDTDTTLIAGTVALGLGGGGIGGGVGVTTIDKDTRAWIGSNAVVDARGQNTADMTASSGDAFDGTTAIRGLQVRAQSSEDLFTIAAAGAGGLYVGIAGAVSVAAIDSDTAAYIGDGAQINTSGGTAHAAQDVNVTARNDLEMLTVAGALGVGAAGIAGSVDVGVIRNDTTAYIGNNASVNAARDIDVNALSRKDIDTFVVSASGGLAGIAAGVAVYSAGGALDGDSRDRLKSDDGDTVGSYADVQATDGSITDSFLSGYSDSRIQSASAHASAARSGTGVSGRFTATETHTLPAGNAAFIGSGATVSAGRHVDVDARETVSFDMLTGALAIGAVGLGAGVGVANFRNDNRAYIGSDATVTAGAAGNVTVTAQLNENLGALGIAGTGGIVAVDAAVAVLGDTSSVVASVGDNVTIDRANLVRLEAEDDRTLEAETYSASAGAITAGASVATTSIGGATGASFGAGARIGQGAYDVNDVEVSADANHAASAEATAGKAGLGLAASGTVATASINPVVSASVGNSVAIAVQNGVDIDAVTRVAANARATGINVSLGGSVGASIARATASPQVSASLGTNSNVVADDLLVRARQLLPAGGYAANASATGAAGGLLVGVNATSALARNTAIVQASVGGGSTLAASGSSTVSAENYTSQRAVVSGISVGIVALGANLADAESNTVTHATLGDNVSASGNALNVSASGKDINRADATSGSGGVVSGAAASADTSSTSNTLATTGSGDSSHQISVGSLDIRAAHTTQFNGSVDSLNASIVGASGASANHLVSSTVFAGIGTGGRVNANSVTVGADNLSHKFWLGAGTAAQDAAMNPDNADWNINSGSGGLIDLPAGSSKTRITHATTASVGEDAVVHVLMPSVGNGIFNMDAYNEIIAHDKAKLDSGGAVAVAKAVSHVFVDNAAASVVFGPYAQVVSDVGNINAGARSRVNLATRASADTYGLAGAPSGEAYSVYNGNNQAVVSDGALIRADDGSVNLAGGQSSGGTPTNIVANANVNLWNKTAFPIVTEPDAQSNIVNNASVRLLGTSSVEAAADIALSADKGNVTANATGIGKDIYRETAGEIASGISNLFGGDDVSFDIHGGSTSVGGLAQVTVDGSAVAGIHRFESLVLDYELVDTNGNVVASPVRDPVTELVLWRLKATKTDGVNFSVDPAVGLAANIQKRIDKLRSLMSQYATDAVAVAAYDAEIKFLQHKLVELGFASAAADGSINVGNWNSPSPLQSAQNQIRLYEAQVSGTVSTINSAAGTVSITTTDSLTTETTISSNASTIVSTYGTAGSAGTVANNNALIQTNLQALANYNAGNASYVQLTGLMSQNATLRTEIDALRSANASDQTIVSTRNGTINTLLGNIASRNSQIDTLIQNNAAQSQIDALRALNYADQASISSETAAINALLATMADRNSQIDSKASTIVGNNTSIRNLQDALETAFSNGSAGNNAIVATINTLQGSNTTLASTISGASGTISTSQTAFSGYASIVGTQNTTIGIALNDRDTALGQIADLTAQLPTLSDTPANGPIADFVHVDDITVRLGNIRVKGDRLTGSGILSAPGDAQITVTNNTPNFLVLNNLRIASDEGGTIRLNGVMVNSNADINRVNAGGSGAAFATVRTRDSQGAGVPKPEITITSNYDPHGAGTQIPAPAPDIELAGDIENLRGSVNVLSKAGSILVNGNIRAGTVNIKAENGDFVQSYVDGFNHVGGDPASIQDHGTSLGGGIIANGSVFISARYLNINSLVQSGIEQWNLVLPADPILTGSAAYYGVNPQDIANAKTAYQSAVAGGNAATIAAASRVTLTTSHGLTVTYDVPRDRIEASTAFALADSQTGDWATRTGTNSGYYALVSDYGNIGANYDPVTDRYLLDGEVVKGGYIQLFGQIINTSEGSAGRLRVLDGYGQINVTNSTGRAVVLNLLDAGADPTGTGRGTAGVIDIMDVQGINADNTANVIHSVYTRDYNVGTGAASVMLEQKSGRLNLDGSMTVFGTLNTGIDASATDGRNTAYNPQSGLRYAWTTGTDNSSIKYWEFSGSQFLGISSLRTQPSGSVVSQSGPYVLNSYRLDSGTYLTSNAGLTGTRYTSNSQTYSDGDSIWVKTGEWTNCNWWTICIAQDYHTTWTQTIPTKTITTKTLKADYPIAIEFSGWNAGTIAVNSASDVILNGEIRNRAGTTTITAGDAGVALSGVSTANRSIVQNNDLALITSRDLMLSATGSVGGTLNSDPARSIQTALTGVLNASADNGNVLVTQTIGDMRVGAVTATGNPLAGTGRVILNSDGNIVADSVASLIQGGRVELTSENGGVGSIAGPLAVNVGYTDNLIDRRFYGLRVAAAGDIGIETQAWSGNTDGNLLVDTVVSRGGDVRLVSPGRILDNNPLEQADTRTWNELLNFWDSLGLRVGQASNQAKQKQAVRAFEQGMTQNYQVYWLIRQRQADGGAAYDASFQYSATQAERDVLAAQGMTAPQIAQFEQNRTQQYHDLHAQVGALTPVYDGSFQYAVTSAEEAQILEGSSWTDRELGISITPGLLKTVTSTNPVIKNPNVEGRNVSLEAGVAIGESLSGITIPTSILPQDLTDVQKVALAAAERTDLVITDSLITVSQRKPINFNALTGMSAIVAPGASGHADNGSMFLASMGNGLLDTISAPGQARIKVRGSIVNVGALSPAIQTGDLVLEAAGGGIGYVPDDGVNPALIQPLRMSLVSGAKLVARAADNVDIVATGGDINVDTVFSRKDVGLTAAASILDAFAGTELNVLADNMTLTALGGSIGSAANPLDVGVDVTGRISAYAPSGAIHLNGPLGTSFNIAEVAAGDVARLSADVDMLIDGPVSAPGQVGLVAGGDIAMTQSAAISAGVIGALVNAGSLTMADGASINVGVGTIRIVTDGDMRITGIETGNDGVSNMGGADSSVYIESLRGSIYDAGDTRLDIITDTAPAAKLIIKAAGQIGGNPLDVRLLNLEAVSGGLTHINEQDSVNVESIQAGGEVLFNAGVAAPGSITGGTIASSGGPANLAASGGGVSLAGVTGQTGVNVLADAGIDLGAAASAGGSVFLGSTAGDINIGTGSAAGGFTADATAGNLAAGPISGSSVGLFALGNLVAGPILAGSRLDLGADTIDATAFHTGTGFLAANLANYGGDPASLVDLTVSSPTGVAFGTFSAADASLFLPQGALRIADAFIYDRATITNPLTFLLIDQVDRSPQPADIQVWAPSLPFSLNLAGRVMETNATVIHYKELTHSVISLDPGVNPDLRQNIENGLALTARSVEEDDERRAEGGEGLLSFDGLPVAMPDCTKDPLPQECR